MTFQRVVENEDAVRSFTRQALERSDYRVLEARNGSGALDVFAAGTARV